MDQPFEPVYADENGNWVVPLLNYREKRADWCVGMLACCRV